MKSFGQLSQEEQAVLMDAYQTNGVKGLELLSFFGDWRKPMLPKTRKHKLKNTYVFLDDVVYRISK